MMFLYIKAEFKKWLKVVFGKINTYNNLTVQFIVVFFYFGNFLKQIPIEDNAFHKNMRSKLLIIVWI